MTQFTGLQKIWGVTKNLQDYKEIWTNIWVFFNFVRFLG